MQTVVETPSYLSDAERLFSPDERKAIVDRLAADPTCGVIVPGSGGIRKVRFGFGGRGKSGGARIIYLFSGDSIPVFVLGVFAKNEKANLSTAERNALARLVTDMVESYRRGRNDKSGIRQDQSWARRGQSLSRWIRKQAQLWNSCSGAGQCEENPHPAWPFA